MKNTIFTEGEKKVLKAHFAIANFGSGAETIEELLDDNYSFATVTELAEATGYTVNQIKGFVSSLVQKSAIYCENGKLNGTNDNLVISENFMEGFDPETNFMEENFLQ